MLRSIFLAKYSAMLFIFIAIILEFDNLCAGSPDWNVGEYDFIVVGGGVAGCTVASRLAESGKYTVLLVEEGGLPHADLEIPALSANYVGNPDYVNIYPSVKQDNAGLGNNGIINYRYGRTLGGGSSVNGQVLNRGSPYNNWAAITRDDSWNYDSMLKYFKKYETYTGDFPSEERGFDGPITVSKPRHPLLTSEWLNAGNELGYPIADSNGPQIPSFTLIDFTQRNGRRVSSFTGYILPMLEANQSSNPQPNSISTGSPNLKIVVNSKVTKIIFEGKQAKGIRIDRSGTNSSSVLLAKAKLEIIVSAGVVGSPILLLKSGIGPSSNLTKVHTVSELPVGQNFQDHIYIALPMILNGSSGVKSEDRELTPQAFQQFLESGYGPYASTLGSSAQAFMASTLSSNRHWPDLLLSSNRFRYILQDSSLIENELQEEEILTNVLAALTRPKSRGSITADVTNPDWPLIDFQYLSHTHDLQTILEGIKFLVRICEETKTYKRMGCRLPQNPVSQCQHFSYRSDEYWECYVKERLGPGLHGVGTCRMGKGESDPEAVVDTKLRVIGAGGLRIVDASIMPTIVNANTQSAVYAIAEKASDMILDEWNGAWISI